jgi:hypothetical protein
MSIEVSKGEGVLKMEPPLLPTIMMETMGIGLFN